MWKQCSVIVSAGMSMISFSTNAFSHSMALPHTHEVLLSGEQLFFACSISALAVISIAVAYRVKKSKFIPNK